MSQAFSAAASVVLGVVVGVFTNLITAGFTVPLAVGLGVTVLAWVALVVAKRPDFAADPGATITYGHSSPVVNAPRNSGAITINSPASCSGEPSADRDAVQLWQYSAGGAGRRARTARFRPS